MTDCPLVMLALLILSVGAAYLAGLGLLRVGLWLGCVAGWRRGHPGGDL